MKKHFSWVTAIITGLILVLMSCNNASQITFIDENKSNFTDDGFSKLTIGLGNEPTYRNIVPDDWDDITKGKLLYVLTGSAETTATSTIEVPTTVGENTTANVFTWDELSSNTAVIKLQPLTWQLTLTAYVATDVGKKTYDPTNISLKSAEITVDLTSGAKKQTFDLKTDSTSNATGALDLQVNFFNQDYAQIKNVVLQIFNNAGNEVAATGDFVKGAKTTSDFAVIGKEKYSSIPLAANFKAGQHTLKITFNDAVAKPILVYEEPILIEAGNTSRGIIDIPKDAFASIPLQPTKLDSTVSFNPSSPTVITIGDKIINAQEIADASADPSGVCTTYDAEFIWNDNSYNETSFELVLSNGTDTITISKNSGTDYAKDNAKCITVVGTGKYLDANTTVTWKAGGLHAGSKTLTVSIPTTYSKFTSASISAINSYVNEKRTVTPHKLTKDIGMNTVIYGLTTQTPAATATITYLKDTKPTDTAEAFFVMAYEVNTPYSKLLNAGPAYPCISLKGKDIEGHELKDAFDFEGWKLMTNKDFNAPELQTTVLNGTDTLTQNIVVYPSWVSPLTLNVSFPSASNYKDQTVTANGSDLIIPVNKTVTITANSVSDKGTISAHKFKVYKCDGSEIQIFGDGAASENIVSSITVDKEVLTWDTTNYEVGGNFRAYISYTFTPKTGDTTAVTIGGSVYIKLNQ